MGDLFFSLRGGCYPSAQKAASLCTHTLLRREGVRALRRKRFIALPRPPSPANLQT